MNTTAGIKICYDSFRENDKSIGNPETSPEEFFSVKPRKSIPRFLRYHLDHLLDLRVAGQKGVQFE